MNAKPTPKKLSPAHRANIPANRLVDGELEEGETVRMVDGVSLVKDRYGATYYYKGFRFELDENVSTGYVGRYKGPHVFTDSLAHAKEKIDAVQAQRAAAPAAAAK
jgi:hypothetical protein